jgi:hypothetical protein
MFTDVHVTKDPLLREKSTKRKHADQAESQETTPQLYRRESA